jgi:hypothetical protein
MIFAGCALIAACGSSDAGASNDDVGADARHDPDATGDRWQPETNDVTKVSAGVFDTLGQDGQVRLNVVSPSGKAWWRNVEMTGYFRYVPIT